jgi:MinD superfamily P-loop ATPase
MLIACWSPKGGTGTTVVSCGLALVLSRPGSGRPTTSRPLDGVLVADLCGDVPAVLGVPGTPAPGLGDWLAAGADVPAGALRRLEVEAGPGLRLLAWGEAPSSAATSTGSSERGEVLAAALAADGRPVVVDCGSAASGAALAVAAAADLSLLVLRPCYLALRRALAAPIRPAGVVLVNEPGRALSRRDVEDLLGIPVRAEIDYEEAIARAVDAGLLGSRIPRTLERALRAAA